MVVCKWSRLINIHYTFWLIQCNLISEKLVVKDGKRWCTDLLDYLIEENDCIRDNETVIKKYIPANSSQDSIVINIYLVHDQTAKVGVPKFVSTYINYIIVIII